MYYILGMLIDCSNIDTVDCGIKKAMFIGYVNNSHTAASYFD